MWGEPLTYGRALVTRIFLGLSDMGRDYASNRRDVGARNNFV